MQEVFNMMEQFPTTQVFCLIVDTSLRHELLNFMQNDDAKAKLDAYDGQDAYLLLYGQLATTDMQCTMHTIESDTYDDVHEAVRRVNAVLASSGKDHSVWLTISDGSSLGIFMRAIGESNAAQGKTSH